ncbi:MAG: hypothetical protein RLW68_01690 [Devosia marina]|uniref:hypothetical protein n=1 Tax=Devosia marina TaxID=2683198 RepID=UPI0032EB7728
MPKFKLVTVPKGALAQDYQPGSKRRKRQAELEIAAQVAANQNTHVLAKIHYDMALRFGVKPEEYEMFRDDPDAYSALVDKRIAAKKAAAGGSK